MHSRSSVESPDLGDSPSPSVGDSLAATIDGGGGGGGGGGGASHQRQGSGGHQRQGSGGAFQGAYTAAMAAATTSLQAPAITQAMQLAAAGSPQVGRSKGDLLSHWIYIATPGQA